MGKFVLVLLSAALLVALFSMPAFPRGNGKGGGGSPSHGAGATPSGSPSPSGKALENSNGQFISDRKFGKERAAERKSAHSKGQVPPADEPRKLQQ